MKISKTIFKAYTRCPICPALDDIYRKKGLSTFSDDDEKEEILRYMFDTETGDDLIEEDQSQVETMLPYYTMVEQHAMEIAQKIFGDNIIHNVETKKQKKFSFVDKDNEFYCYLDGYQEDNNKIRVFEVKATTTSALADFTNIFSKNNSIYHLNPMPKDEKEQVAYQKNLEKLFDRYHSFGCYVFDLAVERFIIEKSLDKLDKDMEYYLCVLNNNYQLQELYHNYCDPYLPSNNEELISFIDLTSITKLYMDKIDILYQQLLKNLDRFHVGKQNLGKYCEVKAKSKCCFLNYCWKDILVDGSILEYYRLKKLSETKKIKHTLYECVNQGMYRIDSIPTNWLLNHNQKIQYNCLINDNEYINKNKIKKGISQIVYPIYHLDFESFSSPLPRFKGEKPYSQSLFQFSIHIEKKMKDCDIEKNHVQFLAQRNDLDCRKELAKKLIETIDLTNGGTVLVYNKNFECTRIAELANFFPEYKNELLNIKNRIFDLKDLVENNQKLYSSLGFTKDELNTINYYNNNLHGSFSIKKVLPLFSKLSYKDLSIANGLEAQAAYAKFSSLPEDELQELRQNLSIYCRQDTWAMVVILWGLIDKINK